MDPLHVPAGATIFRAGDPSLAVYVIEDGEVAITVGEGTERTEVVRLHSGELFGESGVLECRPRSATATALVNTRLLVTDAEVFLHAFGLNNDRALALVKLLCRRLRSTTLRAAHSEAPAPAEANPGRIRLFPDVSRLGGEAAPVEVVHLPFQVGNRFGGETLPMASNRSFCIPARDAPEFAAPHFEILRRGGKLGVRDLGTRQGTIVNGTMANRLSQESFIALHGGSNEVIAGRPDSPFRFRIEIRSLA